MSFADKVRESMLHPQQIGIMKKNLKKRNRHIKILLNTSLQKLAKLEELYSELNPNNSCEVKKFKKLSSEDELKQLEQELIREKELTTQINDENEVINKNIAKIHNKTEKVKAKNTKLAFSISKKIRKCITKGGFFKSSSQLVPNENRNKISFHSNSSGDQVAKTRRYSNYAPKNPELLRKSSSHPNGITIVESESD